MSHVPPEIVIGGPAHAPFELVARSFLESGLNTAPRPSPAWSQLTASRWRPFVGRLRRLLPWQSLCSCTGSRPGRIIHTFKNWPGVSRRTASAEVLSYGRSRPCGAFGAGTYTLGHLEHLDVESATLWSKRPRGADDIGPGASLGGVAVLRYASDHPELTGVVIVSSPAGWQIPLRLRALLTVGLVRTRPGRWIARRRMGVRIRSGWTAPDPPQALTDRITSPLAVVHGRRDALIPVRWGLELQLRADARRYVVLAHDMGHAFDPKGHDAICSAVDWTLAQAR